MEGEPKMLTVREAATQARVHPETVRVWLRSGQLKGRRRGGTGRYLIPPDELQRFLSGGPDAPG